MTTEAERRQEIIDGLFGLAECLGRYPEMPTPYDVKVTAFWQYTPEGHLGESVTQDDARDAMQACPGDWDKEQRTDFITYTRKFGALVSYQIGVDRSTVCKRVQTGTRTIPAQPEHDEPVYEWKCD